VSESTNSRIDDVYQKVYSAQDRFNYFFLGASAIAFGLIRTEGQPPSRWMLPVAAAVLCWGVSFLLGTLHLRDKITVYLANLAWLGIHEGVDTTLTGAGQTLTNIRSHAEKLNKRSAFFGRWQFYLFFVGATLYVIGHTLRVLSDC